MSHVSVIVFDGCTELQFQETFYRINAVILVVVFCESIVQCMYFLNVMFLM